VAEAVAEASKSLYYYFVYAGRGGDDSPSFPLAREGVVGVVLATVHLLQAAKINSLPHKPAWDIRRR
jgi:hypothetical protein